MNHVHRKLRARLEVAAIIAAILIGIALALPAYGQECTTLEISETVGYEGSIDAVISSRVDTPNVKVDLIYPYLQIHVDPASYVDEVQGVWSFEIAGPNGTATVCPDGSVSFASAAAPNVVDAPADEPEPAEVHEAETQPVELVEVELSDAIPWAPMEARVG